MSNANHARPPSSQTTRTGLILFAVYLLLYGGFMLLNTFAPDAMEMLILPGINLAVAYGIGLIVAAFVLALWYGWLCRDKAGA